MPDTKISALASGDPGQAGDEFVLARGGANYKLTLAQLMAAPGAIGGGTAAAGTFTTLAASDRITASSQGGGGANPAINFSGSLGYGFWAGFGSMFVMAGTSGSSNNQFRVAANLVQAHKDLVIGWDATASSVGTGASDTGLSRVSAGVLGVGTGAAGSVAGTLHALTYASAPGTAIPAGGANTLGFRATSTANFGVFFGSGAPSLSAAQGSIYLRSDGSSTSTRAYINTDGGTTWTAVTTAA